MGVMDTFVIRVAGNVCDTDEVGSIEYGLAHVNTPVLVVLGHTQCGAVTAVTHAVQGRGHALERNIPPLVDNIQPAVERTMRAHPNLHGDAVIPPAIEENVWQGIDDLFMSSPSTRNLVKSGEVKVVGAIYDVGTGRVKWLPESKTGRILAQVESRPNRAMNAMSTGGHGDAHASATTESGHGEAGGHGGAAHVTKEVHAEPVTLIGNSRLAELDRARHRETDVAAASMAAADRGMSLLWKIGIALCVVVCVGGLMFKSGTLGRMGVAGKLYTGFTSVVALALVIGCMGYRSLAQVTAETDLALATTELDATATQLGIFQYEFVLVGIADRQRGEDILKEHKALTEQYHDEFTGISEFKLDQAETGAVDAMQEANGKYEKAFAEVAGKFHDIEEIKEEFDELGEQMDEQIAHVLQEHESDLTEMEQAGASIEELALQIELVGKLAKCELLAVKISHAEVGFLL